jgi:hypothetical protein
MRPSPARLVRLLRTVLAATGLACVMPWLLVALVRVAYPFELEWNEGSQVAHVARVLRGEPLYVAPSLAFVPQLYTPLYYWVAAPLAGLLGLGLLPLRLVSLLATLGSLGLVFALVRREKDARCGLFAAGLFAASYAEGGAWLEVARSDSLALFWVLLAAWLLRARGAGVWAGLAVAAAFFTKQTTLVIAVALAAGVWLAPSPARCSFAVSALSAIALGCLALDAASDGWFWYYAFGIASRHETEPGMWSGFWTRDVARVLPALALAAALGASRSVGRKRFFAALLAGGLASAWLGRLHVGGYANVLMPLHAVLAVAAGLGLGGLLARGPRAALAGAALALLQLVLFAYDPLPLLPPASAREDEERLMTRLQALDGPLYAPYSGWLAERLGRPPHAHFMAMADVRRADPARGLALDAEVRQAIARRAFAAMLLAYDHFPATTAKSYREVEPPYADAEPPWIRSGPRSRPTRFLVPR